MKKQIKIAIGAAAVLLMLPVLFVLMLPSLIFGGLTSSGSAGQPILNDNASIVQNTNDIAFAVNQILGEGITDAEARIAQDFAATGGDNYEVVNPYASDMSSNTNSFIAQYCAAKGDTWDTISWRICRPFFGRARAASTPTPAPARPGR